MLDCMLHAAGNSGLHCSMMELALSSRMAGMAGLQQAAVDLSIHWVQLTVHYLDSTSKDPAQVHTHSQQCSVPDTARCQRAVCTIDVPRFKPCPAIVPIVPLAALTGPQLVSPAS